MARPTVQTSISASDAGKARLIPLGLSTSMGVAVTPGSVFRDGEGSSLDASIVSSGADARSEVKGAVVGIGAHGSFPPTIIPPGVNTNLNVGVL